MKKIFALLLAIAMLLTSVAAFAEEVEAVEEPEAVEAVEEPEAVEPAAPKGTPNINTFATMKVKYMGAKFGNQNWNVGDNYYLITLSKPVDRLLVKWGPAEKGAEPEELAVDENLQATAIAWGHKYMPGTEQYYATWSENGGIIVNTEDFEGFNVFTSEEVYDNTRVLLDASLYYDDDPCTWGAPFARVTEFGPYRWFEPWEYTTNGVVDEDKWDALIAAYIAQYPQYRNYEIVEPVVLNGIVTVEGSIQGSRVFNRINRAFQTVVATPDQTAFMTVQGDWAVYYNRSGKIVGIELFEGQF